MMQVMLYAVFTSNFIMTINRADDCKIFLRSIFSSEFPQVAKPSEAETKILDERDLYRNDNTKRCYMHWRRTNAIFILPFAIVSVIWNGISIKKEIDLRNEKRCYYDYYYYYAQPFKLHSALGLILNLLPKLYQCLILLACLHLYRRWYDFERSRLIVRITWLMTIVFTFAPAFFKPEWIISQCLNDAGRERYEACTESLKESVKEQSLNDETEKCYNDIMGLAKMTLGLKYFFQIIPTSVTLSEGLIVGCLIVRGLLPSETLPEWIFLVQTPFSSLFIFAVFIFMLTVYGDVMLTISIAIFVVNPWILLWKHCFNDKRNGAIAYIIHQILNPSAAILALGFAIKFVNENMYVDNIPWGDLGRVIISMIIQKFFTKVFMADTVYQMTEYDDRIRSERKACRDAAVVEMPDMETQHIHEKGNEKNEIDFEASNDKMLAQRPTAMDSSSDVGGATDATDREKGADTYAVDSEAISHEMAVERPANSERN